MVVGDQAAAGLAGDQAAAGLADLDGPITVALIPTRSAPGVLRIAQTGAVGEQ